MQTVLWKAWAVRERTEVGAPLAQGRLSGFNVSFFVYKIGENRAFREAGGKQAMILAGVRGAVLMWSGQR